MEEKVLNTNEERKSVSFIEQKVINLHIGHAKAIAIDFSLAKKYNGICNLRFDDTNPIKEDTEYIENIESDIKWLGFQWANVYYASDYFQELWDFAVWLIKQGRAYVDEQSAEIIAQQKGTTTSPGTNSPFRDRPVEENLKLFEFMNSGKCEPGTLVLRAKIDMAHPNMLFRDPLIYRVLNIPHIRTGNKWNAYPMYDFTHGQCDYLEGVTHSWCTLEFVEHRPLYDLFVTWMKEWKGETDNIEDNRPRQTEFNKLNLNYTLMSKRNLLALVNEKLVNGWDDPRMPTICGFRRRGYSPESIVNFIDKIGYTKLDALNDMALLESAVRDDLNSRAIRVSAVIDPVKVVITNYPEGQVEQLEAINNPENEADGTHTIEFSRELWIERDDFMKEAEKKFMRLAPGKEVRLKNAYIIKCDEEHPCDEDENGNIDDDDFLAIAREVGAAKDEFKIKWQAYLQALRDNDISFDNLIGDPTTVTGSVQNISEETGGVIAGKMNAVVINQAEGVSVMRQQLLVQYEMRNSLVAIQTDVAAIRQRFGNTATPNPYLHQGIV